MLSSCLRRCARLALCLAAASLAVTFSPARALADEPSPLPPAPAVAEARRGDTPVPAGYHAETRARPGLIIGGAIPLGILYTFSWIAGGVVNATGGSGDFLYVPVFGPFLQMTKTRDGGNNGILAIDGLGQAAGAAMLVAGIVWREKVLVRNDTARLTVVPMAHGSKGGGLTLVGTF
jgi:hypothetical protein